MNDDPNTAGLNDGLTKAEVSLRSAVESRVKIFTHEEMRAYAGARGMRVIEPQRFATLKFWPDKTRTPWLRSKKRKPKPV